MSHYRFVQSVSMVIGDALVFFGVLYLSLVLRNLAFVDYAVYEEHMRAFLILFIMYELIIYIAGFFSRQIIPTAKNIFELLVPPHALATVVMLGYFYFLPSLGIAPKTNLLIFASLLFAAMFFWKLIALRLFSLAPMRAVLVGQAADVRGMFDRQPLWNVRITRELSIQAGLDEIEDALSETRADTILVDLDRYPRIDILYKLMFSNTAIVDIVGLREEMHSKIDLERIDHDWFLQHITNRGSTYRFLKRTMDVLAGFMLLGIVIILYPCIWLAIKLDDGGPIYIVQKRVGLRGQEFDFYKFRSMHCNDTKWKDKNHPNKITRVGTWLRKTRLDEFAQCINLIKGDMSLVGPRAILVNEHHSMISRNPFQQARLLAQPGLTGWAQVIQPHAPENEDEALERLAYDLYYIKNISLWLDIKIILKTFKKLAKRMGMK
jgi:lipopolysaccharide/colanic/teichoic acid biosynthesis glycosyltransferase